MEDKKKGKAAGARKAKTTKRTIAIYVTAEQEALIDQRAAKMGISASAIARLAIDAYFANEAGK